LGKHLATVFLMEEGTMQDHNPSPPQDSTVPPAATTFERLLWFIVGPAMLMVLAVLIVNSGSGWWTVLDMLFFVAIALMVWSRWAEIRSGYGRTAYNDPATPAHFRRYVTVMVPVALAAWAVANVLGNHLLQG
jgi:hypothetical protein